MGREIKFRAWDGELMHEDVVVVNGEGFKNEKYVGKPIQFTGLHDKNGNEIYEADIVWDPATNKLFIVEWDEIGTGYLFHNTVIAERTHGIDYYEYEDMCTYGFEVIGNQFENHELLEQTS